MSIFIKPGFWDERKLAPKHWLNLTQLITSIVETLIPPTPTAPYKVYTALLNQTATNNPTAAVLENTTGGTIVWTRDSVGTYTATITGSIFTASKTFVFMQINRTIPGSWGLQYIVGRLSNNTVSLLVKRSDSTSTSVDGYLAVTPIEIRIYN